MGGGRGWGQAGAGGKPKTPFGPEKQCCALSMGPEPAQSTGWAKTAVRNSLVPHAVLLI